MKLFLIDVIMNTRKIELGLGILAFIVGFIFISLVSFFSNTRVVDEGNMESQFISTMGLWFLLGLALIAIGVIVILLVKFEK